MAMSSWKLSGGAIICNKALNLSLAALVLAVLILSSGARAPAQTRETVRLTSGNWQPYTSANAPHYGFASHIVTEAFALVGVEVEYGFFPWKRAMKLAREGKWDGSLVWFDTDERRQYFFYSEPIVSATNVFFHLRSFEFDWREFEDLSDLRVGGTSEYSYGRVFDEAEAAGLFRTYRAISDEVGLKNLLRGRIDIFPGELVVTYRQIRDTFSEADAERITHHPKLISAPPLHLILSKRVSGNDALRALFNEGLRKLKQSGGYDQIIADGMAGIYTDRD